MRLIDADELIHTIEHDAFTSESVQSFVRCLVKGAPTIDPVKHGRWIYYGDETIEDGGRCSVCGGDQPAQWVNKKWQYLETKYCPYCGAYMVGGDEE